MTGAGLGLLLGALRVVDRCRVGLAVGADLGVLLGALRVVDLCGVDLGVLLGALRVEDLCGVDLGALLGALRVVDRFGACFAVCPPFDGLPFFASAGWHTRASSAAVMRTNVLTLIVLFAVFIMCFLSFGP